jgi:hypothetical protein
MRSSSSGIETARDWINALPTDLRVQKRLLIALLDAVESDPRFEWCELGCSVAEGRADALSDLDTALGWTGQGEPPIEAVTQMLMAIGSPIEIAHAPLGDTPRWWVVYADGGQLDLVLMPAATRPGRAPGSRALLDRIGRLSATFEPGSLRARSGEPREWLLDGWEALANVAKYLRRGAHYEAFDQLGRARGRVFQLHAQATGLRYPVFGLTTLLDAPAPELPVGIDATYPVLSEPSLRAAALAAAELLVAEGVRADAGQTALSRWVQGLLAERPDTSDTEDRPSAPS